MKNSAISWTHHTANFWWGCMKVSAGCSHCYAETLSNRYGKKIWGPAATTDREEKVGIWKDILKWDKEAGRDGIRRRVFVSSMSDFLEDHPAVENIRWRAMDVIENLKNLDVLVLTKRPENATRFLRRWYKTFPAHVWMGTSIEDQQTANERIPHLINIPASIRFLSVEPMLNWVDLGNAYPCGYYCAEDVGHIDHPFWASGINSHINWVICGGESGPKCRPFAWDWARDLRNQCQVAKVAFWMKQGGGHPNKREGFDDIPEDLHIRELPVIK